MGRARSDPQQIKDNTIDIEVVPDLQDYATIGCAVEEFEGLPIVSLNGSPMLGLHAAAKRVTDIVLSAVALLLGAPAFLLVAIAVKATSRGPIFYGQERMGLDGRTFKMYKFRSMRVDAESATGAWARQGDDRRTPIGAFLRATSLDEIRSSGTSSWDTCRWSGCAPNARSSWTSFATRSPTTCSATA